MENQSNKSQVKQIIRRRKNVFLAIFLLITFVCIVVAIALPPIYRSEATIRIDDQEIPEEFVQTTATDFVEERIEKIRQQIFNGPILEEIVENLHLLPQSVNDADIAEFINDFRNNIDLETIVSEMKSKPGGKTLSFTVAFKLAHEGKNPETVQQVTDKLANLFIQEDARAKQRVVSATTDFLKIELERLKSNIDSQEKKIREFKEKHLRELPSDLNSNIGSVSRYERELEKVELDLRNLKEKKLYLESQIGQIEPLSPIVVEGDKIAINPNQRLKELNLQLTKLKSIYSDKHPDIVKLKREIAELESQLQNSNNSVEMVKRLKQLEIQLASTESQFGPDHPDAKALKKEIALISNEINGTMTERSKIRISEEKPDNPAYINLLTQINATNIEIQAIEDDKKNIKDSLEKYQRRIEKTPAVEKELNSLTRDYEALKDKYEKTWNEVRSAQLTQKVEGEQRGQRFIIASPANFPTKPYKPNRLAIILVGFLIAIGISTLFTALQESLDNTIKSTDELKQLTNVPVLSSISYILTDRERRLMRFKEFGLIFLIIIALLSGLYFVDKYVIDIEYLWSIILERIKMIA